jgi:replicative DNA helicase
MTEISLDDMAAYQALVDPDAQVKAEFNWGEDYQRVILSMLMVDRIFLTQSLNLVRPSYFTNKAHQGICAALFTFFDKYKQIPRKEVIVRHLQEKFKTDQDKLFYLAELNKLYSTYEPGLDSREAYQYDILNFAKVQSLKEAFNRSLAELKSKPEGEETWDKIYNILKRAMQVEGSFEDDSLFYFQNIEERYARMKKSRDSQELFTLGFHTVDQSLNAGGGKRGQLVGVMALSGVGKSLYLARIGVANILRGKKVLYISTEMNPDDIAMRFDAQFANHNIRTLLQDEGQVVPKIYESIKGYEDPTNQLVIKWFPSKTADVNMMRGYHEKMKMNGFVPDMIIVDYVGEMKDVSGIPIHESREQLVGELTAWMGEEQCFGATAFQPNRQAGKDQEEHIIDQYVLGASFAQVNPLYLLISLNQRDDEKAQSVGRGFICKNRDGKNRVLFHLQWDDETLRIDEITEGRYRSRLSDYKKSVLDDGVMGQAGNKKAPGKKDPVTADVAQSNGVESFFHGSSGDDNKVGRMTAEPEPD